MKKKSYLVLFSTIILTLPYMATTVEAYELFVNTEKVNNEKKLDDNQEDSIKTLSTEESTEHSNSTGSQKNSTSNKSKSDVNILEETFSNKEEKESDSTFSDNQNNSNIKSTTEQLNISSRLYTKSAFEQGKVGVETPYSDGWGEGDNTIRLVGSDQVVNFRASLQKVVQPDPEQRYILMGFRVSKYGSGTDLFDLESITSKIYYDSSSRTGDVLSNGNFSDEFSSEALSGTDYQVSDYIDQNKKRGLDYTFTDSFRESNKTFGIEAMISTISAAIGASERISVQALVKDTRNNNKIGAVNLADTYQYTSFEGVHNAEIKLQDTEINQNTSWDPRDNFISGTKFNGTDFNSMSLNNVKTSGTVDTSTPGIYHVEYSFEDDQSGTTGTVKAIANIMVIENLETIKAHDISIYRGESWEPKDSFDSATDIKGNSIDLNSGVIVSGANKVDTNKPGSYIVTYISGSAKQDVTITVKDIKTAVNVHDSNLYVGDTWKAEDNFDSALDKDGNSVDFTSLTVDDSKVDTNTVGVYEVTYTYDGVTSTAKVTVIAKNGGDVTVKYENEQGKEIHAPQTIKGRPLGEAYDASTAQYNLDIKGYKHKEVQGNVTGTFTEQPQTVTYIYSEGLLQFVDVPQTMSFEDSKISSKTVEVKRKEVDWTIKVEDTRLNKTNWRISAKLVDSFKDSAGEETKARILLYRKFNQSDQWLDNNSEVNVFDGVSTDNKDYYDVSWTEQSGPLLNITPSAVKADQYKGEIQWNLLDAPL